MGDVILTEPIARGLRTRYKSITLFTEYLNVGRLLEGYDDVRNYSELTTLKASNHVDQLILTYETYPNLHYLDGFAKCTGIILPDRMPRLAGAATAQYKMSTV